MGIKKAVTPIDKIKSQQSLAKFISGSADNNPLSSQSVAMKELRKVDPALAQEINREVTDLRKMHKLSQPTEHIPHSTNIKVLMGTASGIINKVSNAIGKGITSVPRALAAETKNIKTKLANRSLDIIESSPEQIQDIVERINNSSNNIYKSFLGPLEKTLKSPPRTKQSMLFGLYQQPAFREMLNNFYEKETEE